MPGEKWVSARAETRNAPKTAAALRVDVYRVNGAIQYVEKWVNRTTLRPEVSQLKTRIPNPGARTELKATYTALRTSIRVARMLKTKPKPVQTTAEQ